MGNAFQFVAADPETAMSKFTPGLRRALKVSPSQLDMRVEQDNSQREAERAVTGDKKRGPKPKI